MKRFLLYFSVLFVCAIGVYGGIFDYVPTTVYAQVGDDYGLQPVAETISIPSENNTDLRVTIVRIINIFLGFLGVIAVCIILYAGYVWMTAGGNEEKVATAKKLLINAVIGLAIILSSFAITSFILNRLQGAIDGTGGNSNPTGPGTGCQDPLGCFPPDQACVEANFVVKSISPHTPTSEDVTGMNNTIVRVLFSSPVAAEANQIFRVLRESELGTTDVSNEFTFAFDEDESLVEATPIEGIVPAGNYTVEVQEGLRDRSGRELTTETTCGTFAKTGQFRTGNQPVVDTTFTGLDPVSINGYSGDGVNAVILGRTYSLRTVLRDDHGNSYVTIRVYKEGDSANVVEFYLDGPRLSLGSSAPFGVVRGFTILENRFEIGPTYVAEVTAHDIDNNITTDTVRFRVVPPSCLNGQLDSDETDIDQGGQCGGGEGNTCSTQSDCSYWLKCLDESNNLCNGAYSCMCKPSPYIARVEYMDGAPGNFITITGRNFGNIPGTVAFNYDVNQNGVIEPGESIGSALAQCREGSNWNDSWIIAEVPQQLADSSVSPSVSVTNLALGGGESTGISTIPSLAAGNILNIGFEETEGAVVEDRSPSQWSVTLNHDVQLNGSGRAGRGIVFPSDADTTTEIADFSGYLRVQSTAFDLVNGSAFVWIKKNRPLGYVDAILTRVFSWGMYIEPNGMLSMAHWPQGNPETIRPVTIDVADNQWHLVGVTFERGVQNGTHFYVDGKLVFTTTTNSAGGGSQPLIIGAGNDGNTQFYSGAMDEVTVWNRALSALEVEQLYRLTTVSKFTDYTNDQFGPNLGLFTYNTTQRPNLCSVTVAADRVITLDDGSVITSTQGSTAAPQGTTLALEGTGFGNDRGGALFGQQAAPVSSWTGELVSADVPFGVEDRVSVYVAASQGERSNPVPFTVTALDDLFPPTISKIEPATTTKGSFITITGDRFGNDGSVYFTPNANTTCPGSGCILAGDLPLACGDVWSNTRIIARVPTGEEFVLGRYFVIVKRGDGINTLASSGNDFVDVVSGAPAPGICRIDPTRGFAPLFDTSKPLTIVGENFVAGSSADPIVRFWYPLADPAQATTWLSLRHAETYGGASIVSVAGNGQEIKTTIPYDPGSGYSMVTGPIKVENEAGLISNGVDYTVNDCREDAGDKPGFHCCTEGPDQGRWKHANFACQGVPREAGYVWRFTTGKMPRTFEVVESCKAGAMPSPSPSTLWPEGKNQCVNAQLQVRFNLPLDPSTISATGLAGGEPRNVSILTCGGDDNEINCNTSLSDVTDQFVVSEFVGEKGVVFGLKQQGQTLLPNTWYRVALSSQITSLRAIAQSGLPGSSHDPLESTKPCELGGGNEAAYCFDFRTGSGDFICTLADAVLEPAEYTTNLLGIVQDSRYGLNQDLNYVFSIAAVTPLTYGVNGISNLACTSINVQDKPWVWGPSAGAPATAAHKPGEPSSHGYATAWESNTVGSEIDARITEQNNVIIATSTLIIDLGNPYAKNVWPLCLEACVNAEIGIEFSQFMNVGDFTPTNITLRKCADESCASASLGSPIQLDFNSGFQTPSFFRVYPLTPLESNSWYLVQMGDGIRSIGGVVSSTNGSVDVRLGTSAPGKEWKFRTKNSAQLCLADSVRVQPDPFTSTFIGEAKIYRAYPIGSPDSCSPYGQVLNPWQFGWDWSVANQSVAKVSDFSFSGSPKNTCTIGCTPAGSDVARTIAPYPICGNGIVEAGEDCDIASVGEFPGISCTFNCLRPGNSDAGVGVNQCGNGVIDRLVGEECDPASAPQGLSDFCSNTCLYTGSSQELTENTVIPVCMSGEVRYGEDCEIDTPNGTQYCSAQCLNKGTPLSQQWCDGYVSDPNNIRYQQVNREQVVAVCGTAVSVCGNGVVEQGEECEQDVNGRDTCSDRCLVQNACDTPAAQCELGTPGCLSDCTLAGSSVTYSDPSVCADGVTGIGEYRNLENEVLSCEAAPDDRSTILGGNPVQVVTSVGGAVDTGTATIGLLETEVVVETSKFLDVTNSGTTDITPVSGNGDYYLRCGYTEYSESIEGVFNNCPVNSNNTLGVGRNSCCMERPIRIAEYPVANAGIAAGTAPVCRNTYIEVTFNQNIPVEYVQDNIELVQSYPRGYACSSHGGSDVTDAMNNLLSLDTGAPQTLWGKVWNHVKNFFARLARITVFASEPNQPITADLTWCTANIPLEVKTSYITNTSGAVAQTRVSLYPTKLLDSERYVSVILRGGAEGIRNSLGVSIKSPFDSALSDQWVFRTSNQICKIAQVDVVPAQSLYTVPNSSKDFVAYAVSTFQDQRIVSIPGSYEWEWSWGPANDQLFAIPGVTTSYNQITSKGFKGHTDGVVSARVTLDTSTENNQQGRTYSSVFSLDALFCQRPWPGGNVLLSEDVALVDTIFEDMKYHFSLSYCADNGNATTIADDLPFFNSIEVITDPAELGVVSVDDLPDALRRYLLFSNTTDDAIGIQIFANPVKFDGSRKTIEEWYTERFGDASQMTKTTIGGYESLMNQTSVYVNAYNIDGDAIYNNIYLFTIDANAGTDTHTVFDQLINSLMFNTNLTNFGRCLKEGEQYTVRDTPEAITGIACTTDFDCRETSGYPKTGTNGICSNAADKFMRDIQRLEQLQSTQEQTDQQFD